MLTGTLPATRRLVQAVRDLSLARDIQQIMTVVRTAARELTGADGATFILRDGDRCHYADEDAIGPLWKGQTFPMTACISGWAMLNRAPAIVPDIFVDERIPVDAYRPTFVKSLVMVPVRTEQPIAAIGNYWASPHTASPWEVELLQALADSTAVAMENVQVYAELEQRVRDRTAQLEAANQELDAFSHSVSHDLRTPLRHLSGFARMLKQHAAASLDAKGQDYLSRIDGAALRMTVLVEELLAFSRLGRAPLHLQPVELAEVVADARREAMLDASGRAVEWTIGALPTVDADRTLLHQVVTNLLSNAVKYTRGRDVARIQVGSYQDHGSVVVYVRDNGAGFDMAHAGRLFGVFQRLHREDEFEGTGVGLANVRRIIARHGGRTWAEGTPGDGAIFYFSFPAAASGSAS